MRNISQAIITEAIVHVLDREDGKPGLSSAMLPLAQDDPVYRYLANHIVGSLALASLTAAKFKTVDDSQPSGICSSLIANTDNFVDRTRVLSELLYGIILNDRRTKSGDLVICRYLSPEYPNQHHLALLKINPSDVFEHQVLTVNGHTIIKYRPLSQAYTNEKLQKCAFIQPFTTDPKPKYHMLLLDATSRTGEVARYFTKDFLGAEKAYDEREDTKQFINVMRRAQNNVRSLLLDKGREEEWEEVEQRFEAVRQLSQVDVNIVASQFDQQPAVKEVLEHELASLPSPSFTTDQKYLKEIGPVSFRGDHGLTVKLSREWKNKMLTEKKINKDGRKIYQIIIETEEWREI